MMTAEDDDDSNQSLFPSVINWNHGGNEVYIVAAFNHWNKSIPLSKRFFFLSFFLLSSLALSLYDTQYFFLSSF